MSGDFTRTEPARSSRICGYQMQIGSWHNDGPRQRQGALTVSIHRETRDDDSRRTSAHIRNR